MLIFLIRKDRIPSQQSYVFDKNLGNSQNWLQQIARGRHYLFVIRRHLNNTRHFFFLLKPHGPFSCIVRLWMPKLVHKRLLKHKKWENKPESLNMKAENSRKSSNPKLFRRSLFTFAVAANPMLSLSQFFNVNEFLKTIWNGIKSQEWISILKWEKIY